MTHCGICGTHVSADGDWYQVCGPCRWGETMKPDDPHRRHLRMVTEFGPGQPGLECGTCVSLVQAPRGRHVRRYVCEASGGRVWRKSWPACGAHRQARDYHGERIVCQRDQERAK